MLKELLDTNNIYSYRDPFFIGEHDIIQEIEYVYDAANDIMVKNPKIDITNFFYIYAKPRGTEKIVKAMKSGTTDYYYYRYRNNQYDYAFLSAIDPTKLYTVGRWNEGVFTESYLYDFMSEQEIELDNRVQELIINDSIMKINDTSIAVMKDVYNPALGGTVDYYPMNFIEMDNIGKL